MMGLISTVDTDVFKEEMSKKENYGDNILSEKPKKSIKQIVKAKNYDFTNKKQALKPYAYDNQSINNLIQSASSAKPRYSRSLS